MRCPRFLAGVALAFSVGLAAAAEPGFQERYITSQQEVTVRSGPSAEFYTTSKLRYGDKVFVVDDAEVQRRGIKISPGWLAIRPPVGSFSWIQDRFLDTHSRQTAQVLGEAEIRVGSSLVKDKPSVKAVTLQRGAQVVILSQDGVTDTDGTWYPIEPAPQEVRYIPAEAVKGSVAPVQVVSQAPPAVVPTVGDPLWTKAEQAEHEGRTAEAIQLYEELGRKMANTDYSMSLRCYNHAKYLRDGLRPSTPPGYQAGRPAEASPPSTDRLVPTPPASPTSRYTYDRDNAPSTQTPPLAAGQPAANAQSQWSGPGNLRKTTFEIDGKRVYALELKNPKHAEVPCLYAAAEPGVNLDAYLNRTVELYGPIIYRTDLRLFYMTVSQVNP